MLRSYQKTLEDQRDELIELREERQFYKHEGIERVSELNELIEFAKIVSEKQVRIHWLKGACLERYNRDIKYNFEDYASDYMLTKAEFDLVKKVVEKYGK